MRGTIALPRYASSLDVLRFSRLAEAILISRTPDEIPVSTGSGSRLAGLGSRAVLAVVFLATFILPGCGYHVAGKAVLLPSDVQTIAVPAFQNRSHQFRIEQKVTAAIKQEFIERTKFRMTSNPAGADAELHGLIKAVRKNVLTFDPQTGRATTLQIQVVAAVTLEDLHTHKPLYANSNYTFREQYQISPMNPVLFEEDQPAIDRLSRDMARTLVTDILEDF